MNDPQKAQIPKPKPEELIDHMLKDLVKAKVSNLPLVISGPALDSLIAVVQLAKKAHEEKTKAQSTILCP
jgi:hypothetical protein